MTSQDKQDNHFYEENEIKEEIHNQTQMQKQGKRNNYYKNYKDSSQRLNQNNLDDKLSNQNVNDYNFQNYRKNQKKKYSYQNKNQNEDFERQRNNSPQNSKKTKKKKRI